MGFVSEEIYVSSPPIHLYLIDELPILAFFNILVISIKASVVRFFILGGLADVY